MLFCVKAPVKACVYVCFLLLAPHSDRRGGVGQRLVQKRIAFVSARPTREARSSSSSRPQRSAQQSSQQLREEEVFERVNRLKEELENKTKEELLALGTAVLHASGDEWMQLRLRCRSRDLVKKFARKVGMRVKSARQTKDKDVLIDELVQLFASATAAWLCMSKIAIFNGFRQPFRTK
eukprot:s2362_g1.t1